jgi:protoporphyrinogen oxidase
MKISVLGAGISGISIASMLADRGFDADIYEKEIDLGGLARSVKIKDFTFDLHGGHVFNSKNNEIKNWVFSKLPQNKWEFSMRNAKILYGSKLINYPFELSLYDLETDDAVECILDLFESGKGDEPLNFHDWLIWKFGKKIADDYLIPYNAKIWAYPLKEMETGWINKKIPLST